ncbi:MAG TPA: hypothetical protein VHZ55_04345, partial [Bryobacteraceae bacterium]|nr:hypothetical protein [Bryobacteraceae bacterium]
ICKCILSIAAVKGKTVANHHTLNRAVACGASSSTLAIRAEHVPAAQELSRFLNRIENGSVLERLLPVVDYEGLNGRFFGVRAQSKLFFDGGTNRDLVYRNKAAVHNRPSLSASSSPCDWKALAAIFGRPRLPSTIPVGEG